MFNLKMNYNSSKIPTRTRKIDKQIVNSPSIIRTCFFTLFIQMIAIYSIVCVAAASNNHNKQSQNVQSPEEDVVYKQQYQNPNYFYSIEIPQGYVCVGAAAPNPNHGCRIDLSDENPDVFLYVDGSYNATYFNTPIDAILGIHIKSILQEGMEIVILKQDSISLGGLSAERIAISYKHQNQHEATVEDIVVAFRTEGRDSEMIYTVKLKTISLRYEKDRALFRLILASWKNDPKL